MAAQPVAVLAIVASNTLGLVEQLRADVQQVVRELPDAKFLQVDGDVLELQHAIGSLHAAERSLLTARQFLRSVADRQPGASCAMTKAEQAKEASARA